MAEPTRGAEYDAEYFLTDRLGEAYHRGNPNWPSFFGRIADALVEHLQPRTSLDVGCAIGMLVEALRDRGVDARGIDISEYAIGQVPEELRAHVSLASATDELNETYDLITCIEVLEHLDPADAVTAISNLARHAPAVLFSSIPDDMEEETHVNVQPPEYWARLFASEGFYRDFDFDANVVAPHAVLFRLRTETAAELAAAYEQELWERGAALREEVVALRAELDATGRTVELVDGLRKALGRAEGEIEEAAAVLLEAPKVSRVTPVRRPVPPKQTVGPRIPLRAPLKGHYAPHLRVLVRRSAEILREEGVTAFVVRGSRRLRSFRSLRDVPNAPRQGVHSVAIERRYARWRAEHDPTSTELRRQRQTVFAYQPLVSVVVPVYDPPADALDAMIRSVFAQTYPRFELCVANAGKSDRIRGILDAVARDDDRVRLIHVDRNLGISGNSNAALALAQGEFVALVDHDDELAPHALWKVVEALNEEPEADFVYTDEDRVTPSGDRVLPYLKPDWSPEFLHSYMYVGHLGVYRRSLVESLGGFRSEYDGSQDYDLALRVTSASSRVLHVPDVLYHWRMVEGSAAGGGKPEARRTNLAALADVVAATGREAQILEYPFANRVAFSLAERPLVSIIVPTDEVENALETVKGVRAKTTYESYEIIVVTNDRVATELETTFGDDVRCVRFHGRFNFSLKCNLGAEVAGGKYLVFLNDDVVPISEGWIESLLQYAQLDEIGGVSPKLLYADDSIQYAGLVAGVRDFVGTAFHTWPRNDGSYHSMALCVRNVSCLTGACMMIAAETLHEVGGWDAVNVPISHSDFDLSYRLLERGLRLVYAPFAELRHLGHQSRRAATPHPAADVTRADRGADLYMLGRWGERFARDPFYPEGMRALVYEDDTDWSVFPPERLGMGDGWWSQPRVLLVSHDLSLSGAPGMLLEIAQALRSSGMLVVVATPTDGPLREHFQLLGVPVVVDSEIVDAPHRARRFMRTFDLVAPNTVTTWRTVLEAAESGLPCIWLVQEPAFGRLYVEETPGAAEAMRAADHVVVPSGQTAELYADLRPDRMSVVRYGIGDPEEGDAPGPPFEREGTKLYVIVLGTVEERKGTHVVVEAVRLLPDDVRDQLEVLIVGRAPYPDYTAKVRSRAAGLQNVRLVGETARELSLAYLKAGDIFICASSDESGPVVVLEAAALAKPIVTTTVGLVPEVFEDETDALFIPTSDAGAIAERLIRLVRDPELRARLGSAARSTFEQRSGVDRYAAEIVELFDAALADVPGVRTGR